MIESEAKKKYCHKTFESTYGVSTCFGADCMAWRWGDKSDAAEAARRKAGIPSRENYEPQGYCGLAGKPE